MRETAKKICIPDLANKDLTVLATKGGIVVDTTTPSKYAK